MNVVRHRDPPHIHPDASGTVQAAAERIQERLTAAVAERGVATLALAGGSTPRQLYELLATPRFAETIPWAQTRLFMGDERCVPASHPDSNEAMVRTALLDGAPALAHFHPMPGGHPDPATGARLYAEILAREIPTRNDDCPSLDVVLLGMGEDGHTASLFPGTPILDDPRWVAEVYVPRLQSWRLSLTLTLLNSARNVMFLVTGSAKSAMLAQIFREEPQRTWPASLIAPSKGEVEWYLDQAAAAHLPPTYQQT